MLPGGQKEPWGQGEQVLEPPSLAVAKRPPAQEEGGAGAGGEGDVGVPKAGGGGEGPEGIAHTKGQPWGHHTMGHPLVSRP